MVKLIVEMFTVWKTQYKSKMKEESWGLITAQTWALALQDLGITQDEFYTSYCQSLSLEWVPTTPYDFLKLSRHSNSNKYTDMREAYMNAANQKYPHVVIYETARRLGFWELKTQAESQSWKTWQEIYPKVCDEHSSGVRFSLPKAQRVGFSHASATPEFVDKKLEEIREILDK